MAVGIGSFLVSPPVWKSLEAVNEIHLEGILNPTCWLPILALRSNSKEGVKKKNSSYFYFHCCYRDILGIVILFSLFQSSGILPLLEATVSRVVLRTILGLLICFFQLRYAFNSQLSRLLARLFPSYLIKYFSPEDNTVEEQKFRKHQLSPSL